ncbi:hypothetical protein, partial [Acidocella aminolytica]
CMGLRLAGESCTVTPDTPSREKAGSLNDATGLFIVQYFRIFFHGLLRNSWQHQNQTSKRQDLR